jgi:HEAT repeat protein
VPALLDVLHDPVPRVRGIALHALKCDECKLQPLQPRPELTSLAMDWAEQDPSRRVRREATSMLAQAPNPMVTRLMRTLATGAADHVVRGLARTYIRRVSAATS